MSVAKNLKKTDPDTQTTIMAWVFIIGIVVIVIIAVLLTYKGNLFNPDLTLAEEKEKCEEVVKGTEMMYGVRGYCSTYIGSDGETHYKYVQDLSENKWENEKKDVYIIWETGKGGKY